MSQTFYIEFICIAQRYNVYNKVQFDSDILLHGHCANAHAIFVRPFINCNKIKMEFIDAKCLFWIFFCHLNKKFMFDHSLCRLSVSMFNSFKHFFFCVLKFNYRQYILICVWATSTYIQMANEQWLFDWNCQINK